MKNISTVSNSLESRSGESEEWNLHTGDAFQQGGADGEGGAGGDDVVDEEDVFAGQMVGGFF